jgi:hypothetical protein
MNSQRRQLLVSLPLLGGVAAQWAHAQGNANQPATGDGQQSAGTAGEVQAGAGTLGDITTGSSGPRPLAASKAAAPTGEPAAEANKGQADTALRPVPPPAPPQPTTRPAKGKAL